MKEISPENINSDPALEKCSAKYRNTGPEIINRPLVEKMISGDHEAFKAIYLHTVGPLTDFLAILLHSAENAEDVAQNIFADLWKNRDKINPAKNFKGYLYTVARNAAFVDMKRRKLDEKYYNYAVTSTPDFSVSPDEVVITAELALMINIYISNMPTQRKRVYEMSRDEGMSDKQIAEELKIAVETVRSHKKAALKGIREITALCMLLFFS